MPTFPPSLSEALTSLQRQIDQINTARPGPMSWGPDDGHIRFYATDGRVLFQANSAGASVESRGVLTGLTPLLDSIRAKDDQQDGRLDGHDGDVARIDAKNTQQDGRLTGAEGRLDGHDSTLASHNSRITTAQARADKGVSDAAAAQSSANAAQSTANAAQSAAATAQSRADAAHSLASAAATQSQVDDLVAGLGDANVKITALQGRVAALEAWLDRNMAPYPGDFSSPIPDNM